MTHDLMTTSVEPTTASDTPPPRLPAWARVLLSVVLFLPAGMAALFLFLIPGFAEAMASQDTALVLALAAASAICLAAYLLFSVALVRWVDRRPVAALGLRPGRRGLLALGVGIGVSALVAVLAGGAVQLLDLGRRPDATAVAEMGTTVVLVSLVAMVLRSFVLQGIGEEVLFRGYLLQSLRARPVLAVLIVAVAFTIPHLASGGGQENLLERVLYLAMPFGFSFSAGFASLALGSVWAGIGIHGGFHIANGLIGFTGLGADGPAVWLLLGLFHLLAGVVIALRIPRARWEEIRAHGPYAARSRR